VSRASVLVGGAAHLAALLGVAESREADQRAEHDGEPEGEQRDHDDQPRRAARRATVRHTNFQ
jgi:hypothetical protein